ncbi:MAG: TIM barrel protein [Armatimonadia bacterium]|nr:TIM barrel protein [Armatimonadia bacterium]
MDISRISACTYPMREKPYDYALRVLADSGVFRADLWGRKPHFPELPTDDQLVAIEATSAETGVAIANLGTYPGGDFGSDDADERAADLDRMRVTIDAAKRLGARSIRVMPGHGEDPAIIDRIAPLMAESAAHAQQAGVYLGMENHRGSIAGNPEHALQLCEAVGNPHFGVLYEPCNLWHAGVDYREGFNVFSDWIVHVHIKDGRRSDDGFERVHLGEGDIDVAWVVDALEGIGYDGDYALEYELPAEIQPVETGLAEWLRIFQKLTT